MVRNKTSSAKIGYTIVLTILVCIATLSILPIWHTLVVSLSDQHVVAAGRVTLLPVGLNIAAYDRLVQDTGFLRAFGISVLRVVLGLSVSFIAIVLMAYPLSKEKEKFRYRNIFMWILVFTMLFRASLIPLYIVVRGYGLHDSIWALVLANSVPVFNVILVVNFFRNSPKELEEAAYMDGAGPWYILLKIMIPISTPVLATVSLFIVVHHWNEFFHGLIFTSGQRNYPLQTYIRQIVLVINAEVILDENALALMDKLSNRTLNAAKIFVSMIPVLVVYPFIQRYFVTGITLGSVKG